MPREREATGRGILGEVIYNASLNFNLALAFDYVSSNQSNSWFEEH